MSGAMNQELLDLLLGELEPAREADVRARLAREPALREELAELEALFGFMRRGEEIEPDPAVAEVVMAEARRVCRPSLWQRLRTLPELFRFRFRHSRGFRIAAVSRGAHLVVMLVLLQVMVARRAPEGPTIVSFDNVKADPPEVRPSETFVLRLSLARASRSTRLKQWGVDGQREAIRAGVRELLAAQRDDGSFGDVTATGRAALVLLAEGVQSTDDDRRGRALRRSLAYLRRQVDAGAEDGVALEALVENWALSYGRLTGEERDSYARSIHRLVQVVSDPSGRYWAAQAGFLVPGEVSVPDDPAVVIGSRHVQGDHSSRGEFAARFRAALAPARDGDAAALLALQAPYRL